MKKLTVKINSFLPKTPTKLIEYQKSISIFIYGTLGIIIFFEGCRTFFANPYVCAPVEVFFEGNYMVYLFDVTRGILHLFMDLSATLVLIGLSLLYAAFNYEKSNFVDISLFIFYSLSAYVHWVILFDGDRVVHRPFLGLIPLISIFSIIVLKQQKKPY